MNVCYNLHPSLVNYYNNLSKIFVTGYLFLVLFIQGGCIDNNFNFHPKTFKITVWFVMWMCDFHYYTCSIQALVYFSKLVLKALLLKNFLEDENYVCQFCLQSVDMVIKHQSFHSHAGWNLFELLIEYLVWHQVEYESISRYLLRN